MNVRNALDNWHSVKAVAEVAKSHHKLVIKAGFISIVKIM